MSHSTLLKPSGEKMDFPTIAGLALSAGALLFAFLGYKLSLQTKKEQDERALPQIADPHKAFEFDGAYSIAFNVYPGTGFYEADSITVPGFEICFATNKSAKKADGDGYVFGLLPVKPWRKELPLHGQFAANSPVTEVRVSVRPIPTEPFEVRIRLRRGAGFVSRTFRPDN